MFRLLQQGHLSEQAGRVVGPHPEGVPFVVEPEKLPALHGVDRPQHGPEALRVQRAIGLVTRRQLINEGLEQCDPLLWCALRIAGLLQQEGQLVFVERPLWVGPGHSWIASARCAR